MCETRVKVVGSTENTDKTQTQPGHRFVSIFQPKQSDPINLGYRFIERALGKELPLHKTIFSKYSAAFLRALDEGHIINCSEGHWVTEFAVSRLILYRLGWLTAHAA